jgi:hypothetical protein
MMSDVNASGEIEFPWLPGEEYVVRDPSFTYRNDPEPPKHVMITLAMLAQGHGPKDTAPPEWLSELHVYDLSPSIRALALEHCGRYAVWNDQSKSYDYVDLTEKVRAGTPRTISREAKLRWFWTHHTQLVLSDLEQRGERPQQAVERIQRQWREWVHAQADKFTAKWKDAAAWPPALALSWVMFTGNWRRIAAYLKNGDNVPTSGRFLRGLSEHPPSIFSRELSEHPDAEAAKRAANDLMQALRVAKSRKRVIVRGRLNGQSPMVEISPFDLATLDWAVEKPSHALNAVLERHGAEFYSDVYVDADSLIAAFPAHGMIAKNTKKSAWLLEKIGGSARSVPASEARELARQWLSGQRLPADDATVKAEGKLFSALARRLKHI